MVRSNFLTNRFDFLQLVLSVVEGFCVKNCAAHHEFLNNEYRRIQNERMKKNNKPITTHVPHQ